METRCPFSPTLLADTVEDGVRKVTFRTHDCVCSRQIDLELEGDTLRRVQYTGGCHGNTQGIAKLCQGMRAGDVADRLGGIDCKGRGTSCPDQLAAALRQILGQ